MSKKIIMLGAAVVTLGIAMSACNSNKATTDTDTVLSLTEEGTVEEQTVSDSAFQATVEFFQSDRKGNGLDSTYVQTPSGLKYRILKEGTGKTPSATDNVTVHYEGKLLTGVKFDSSYDRGEPASFPLNGVIAGWTEGLQTMKEGGVTEFYIPSALAYGEQGGGNGVIPPNAPLIFKVELIKVN